MNPEETFEKGVAFRLAGNEAFKNKEFKEALAKYYQALLHLKTVGGREKEQEYKKKANEQLVMIYNNMAAVFTKQDRWDRVLFYAKKATELDPQNVKSKFRQGQAYLRSEDLENAKQLLEEVAAIDPNDLLVKQELAKVATASKQMEDKQKLIYRAMMTKLAQEKK